MPAPLPYEMPLTVPECPCDGASNGITHDRLPPRKSAPNSPRVRRGRRQSSRHGGRSAGRRHAIGDNHSASDVVCGLHSENERGIRHFRARAIVGADGISRATGYLLPRGTTRTFTGAGWQLRRRRRSLPAQEFAKHSSPNSFRKRGGTPPPPPTCRRSARHVHARAAPAGGDQVR